MQGISMRTAKSSLDLEEWIAHYQKQLREEAFFYLRKRGIQPETAEAFRLGFDPGKIGFYVNSGKLGDFFENHIIIPVTNGDGVAVELIGRAIDHREPKYKALLGVEELMFNEEILSVTEDVVLCGGLFDVLSLAQARIPAVCVPSWLSFRETHAERLREKRVFICLGNDELGRRESVRIQTMLQSVAKETFIVGLPESFRDVNDFFVRVQDPMDAFISVLNHTMAENLHIPVAPDVKNITVYTEEYMKRHRGMGTGIPTGFTLLDDALFGGFRSGLYLIAGAASSGKTMLMKQMADHIALHQTPVVYLSWDMTGFELWARSVARIIGIEPQRVLSGKVEPDRIQEANKQYEQISKMLWTVECSMDMPQAEVIRSIGRIAAVAGRMPIVFIDHLSRIPLTGLASSGSATIQERLTLLAYSFKQWCKEWGGTVVAAIPSDLEQEGLPEGVEASADVIMLLKPSGTAYGEEGQSADLQLLKHRNGSLATIPMRLFHQQAKFCESP
ncbi:toprim domain-containing protein [Paenibacillus filicis]|uniref:Toprim domain-containing protein n=1 Tax=Paenibacillus gyeongsangnamensis TaxID=3388067 RepID=A0ABT4Q7W0_9BACL|nr:DnaB-like helicase C-terminal domain-containing protein [Paenibacillus filicis]MCZ8512909.1 toprim domain-containing protein [Paenibacillus filicis]